MATAMRNVMLVVRSSRISAATKFYGEGLRLPLLGASDTWAEFALSDGAAAPRLVLKASDQEAPCSTGYSPLLNFVVSDLDATLPQLLMLGAEMDGPVKHPVQGKVVVIRAPDGHMLGLIEEQDDTL